jgi:CHAD domain-containing protein
MGTGTALTGSRPEHRGLSYYMERALRELETVRTAPDPDAVHDLRVALRRCRSVAAVMEEVDPEPSWPELRRLGKKLFHSLGELRDTQVLAEWLNELSGPDDSVGQKLLADLQNEEKTLRDAAVKSADKFDAKAWKKLERIVIRRVRLVALDGLAAECLALERLEDAKELQARALRSEKPEAWHALRIGVKRFRYTVESLLPTKYAAWAEDLKRLQDLLGDTHDLDVLSETIAKLLEGAPPESHAAWTERIQSRRHERIDKYRQLTVGTTRLWQKWRDELPQERRLQTAAFARLRVTARALNGNRPRAEQISRLAMCLYSVLARANAATELKEKQNRKVMRAAAKLNGIGVSLNRKKPRKAARRFLLHLQMPPGWNDEEWSLLSDAVRYHRGAEPNDKQKRFAKLEARQQHTIFVLAGILRLARILRKCGIASPAGISAENSVDAIILRIPGLEDTAETAARLAAGKHLLESSLERPLILKPVPLAPNVIELPRKEAPSPDNAVASD